MLAAAGHQYIEDLIQLVAVAFYNWALFTCYSLDYEYVAKGFLFRRGKMKVTVSTIFKMKRPGSTELNHLEQVSMSHLVELSVMTSKTVSKLCDLCI